MNEQIAGKEKTNQFLFAYLINYKSRSGSNDWQRMPLHLTLTPWLRTETTPSNLIGLTEVALSDTTKVKTKATTEDSFGINEDIKAMRVERTDQLLSLHLKLIEVADSIDANYSMRYCGEENWQPHVTHKGTRRLSNGAELVIDGVDLVQRLTYKQKALVGRIALADEIIL